MFTCRAEGAADPAVVWELFATPQRWSEWSPHVRGAWGLDGPRLEKGARGYVRLLSAVPVPFEITAVEPGRLWTWKVGPVEMVHRVEATAGGCAAAIDIGAPPPIEAALRVGYAPVVNLLLARLLAKAAAASTTARSGLG
ncbi:MAG: SRPBCC family protein [Actinobacteria bacterium]|uniref:Unannotated protein n=1 Tax=freshwater metagenome TaxID=449393 RepID=A0A6J5ZRC4_9ZZZZ|nr:SRPBCC family protein [Actinomycetota bacterium]